MSKDLPNGIGESLGDRIVVNAPLFVSGAVWHVDNTNAIAADSAGYGLQKQKPFATLSYAISQAAAGDTIVLHDGHEELSLAGEGGAAITIDRRLIIAGAGESDGKPTAKLGGSSSSTLISVTADGVELRNIWFEESTIGASSPGDVVSVQGSLFWCIDCYFEADGGTAGRCLGLDTDITANVVRCTFVSTSTDVTAQPEQGIGCGGGGIIHLDGVVLDDGSVGWSVAAFATEAAATHVVAENISMLRGAKAQLYETGSQVHWSAPTKTGNAQIQEV